MLTGIGNPQRYVAASFFSGSPIIAQGDTLKL
jgi:hypothetical protein